MIETLECATTQGDSRSDSFRSNLFEARQSATLVEIGDRTVLPIPDTDSLFKSCVL
jgi:hypothetical protein